MNLWVPKSAGSFLTSSKPVSFSRTLLLGVSTNAFPLLTDWLWNWKGLMSQNTSKIQLSFEWCRRFLSNLSVRLSRYSGILYVLPQTVVDRGTVSGFDCMAAHIFYLSNRWWRCLVERCASCSSAVPFMEDIARHSHGMGQSCCCIRVSSS